MYFSNIWLNFKLKSDNKIKTQSNKTNLDSFFIILSDKKLKKYTDANVAIVKVI